MMMLGDLSKRKRSLRSDSRTGSEKMGSGSWLTQRLATHGRSPRQTQATELLGAGLQKALKLQGRHVHVARYLPCTSERVGSRQEQIQISRPGGEHLRTRGYTKGNPFRKACIGAQLAQLQFCL